MLSTAAKRILAAKEELTEIDSRFGDADHGVTMEKIALAIQQEVKSKAGSKDALSSIASHIMCINGGSAVPLWSTFFDGMANAVNGTAVLDENAVKAMFEGGLTALQEITTAKVGDKTMMDSICPAVEAILNSTGDVRQMLHEGALAAQQGAKDTEGYVAKFGRAKNYREQTLGTPDAGAVSAMYFFIGMDEGLK